MKGLLVVLPPLAPAMPMSICRASFSLTSVYLPPRPNNSFRSAARLSPLFSSSILDSQSSLPVHTTTCSAYPAMTPCSGFRWSISSPSGRAGVLAHAHVGDGQVETVGNGGGVDFEVRLRAEAVPMLMLVLAVVVVRGEAQGQVGVLLNWRGSLGLSPSRI